MHSFGVFWGFFSNKYVGNWSHPWRLDSVGSRLHWTATVRYWWLHHPDREHPDRVHNILLSDDPSNHDPKAFVKQYCHGLHSSPLYMEIPLSHEVQLHLLFFLSYLSGNICGHPLWSPNCVSFPTKFLWFFWNRSHWAQGSSFFCLPVLHRLVYMPLRWLPQASCLQKGLGSISHCSGRCTHPPCSLWMYKCELWTLTPKFV